MARERIGQILLGQTPLTQDELDAALAQQGAGVGPERLGQILLLQGLLTPEDVLRALAEQWGIPWVDQIPQDRLSRDLVIGLPIEFLKKHALVPLAGEDGHVTIAVSDPLDVKAFDGVANVVGRPCDRVLCSRDKIGAALSQVHLDDASSSDILGDLDADEDFARAASGAQTEDLLDVANRPPIIRLVNTILFQAARSRASDIHIEPFENDVKVRFRIDGVLHERFTPPKQYVAALISRVKVMANLNIAERRLPQDGKSRIRIGEKEIDIRVSTIPTSGGERVVLRLLDRGGGRFSVKEIGFSGEVRSQFRKAIRRPHGIFLLTGPTGSGKTTTLYAALREISTEECNILTVEDPIEYQLPGVGQMQVQPKINLTFANCLRHIVRQDPDVIMVGEIRDAETAEVAIQAALTGHLVFSTLHTNDSASAVTRLLDMNVEPYLVSSSVVAIMAQRLVRVICPECRGPHQPSDEEIRVIASVSSAEPADVKLFEGSGCVHCFESGYRGRTGIFELLHVNDAVRELVIQRAPSNAIRQAAIERGMRTLREDGLRRVFAGETTVAEVMRVTQEDALDLER